MGYSEKLVQNDWIENSVKEQLKKTSQELGGLQDLVLQENTLKAQMNNNAEKDITLNHVKAILEAQVNKPWKEIYGSDSAGVVFAVQFALNELRNRNKTKFSSIPEVTIDGLYRTNTKEAVKAFQKLVFPEEIKKQDRLAGSETIHEILKALDVSGRERVNTSVKSIGKTTINRDGHTYTIDQTEKIDASGERYGTGRVAYKTGVVYEGDFRGYTPDGQGKHTFKNGSFYQGVFKEGKFEGGGTYVNKHNVPITGRRKEGKLVSMGTKIFKSPKTIIDDLREIKNQAELAQLT